MGEALVDYHGAESHVGGAPLHVAALLAGFGWKSHLLTRIGNDADGARVEATLKRHAIEESLLQVDPDEPTGTAIVNEESAGIARFEIGVPAAWDFIAVPPEIPEHDVLHFGTLGSRSPTSRNTLQMIARKSTASLRTCDLNLRAPWVDDAVTDWALSEANVIKLSEHELYLVSPRGTESLFEDHPGLDLIAVTYGGEGATLHRRGSWVSGEAPRVQIVDTVGAGDAFMAGLIHALFQGRTDEEVLETAIESAARALGAPGALRS